MMTAPVGCDDLLRERLQQFTRTLHGLEKEDVRAVHRMRVASRRLREVLPVLPLDPEITRKLSRRLRRVTERLGLVRERDVLLMLVDELRHSGRYHQTMLDGLAAALADEQAQARQRLLDKVRVDDLRRVAAKLARLTEELDTNRSSTHSWHDRGCRSAIDARAARRALSLREAIHHAGAVYLPDRLHAVRIRLKKLRYALELWEEVNRNGQARRVRPRRQATGSPKSATAAGIRSVRRTRDLQTLVPAQDVLGRMHDMQVLIERIREIQASLAPPDLAVWHAYDELVTALDNDCHRLHARFLRKRDRLLEVCDRVDARTHSGRRVPAVAS